MNPFTAENDTGADASLLKAASFVSMEGTVDAHEYNPNCSCSSCQTLLKDYTQFDILDSYVSQHLKYEDELTKAYGFVPCVGGPYGNTATTTAPASQEGEQPTVLTTSSEAIVFFTHNMTMRPVPPMFKHNAYSRFYGVEPEPFYKNYVPKNQNQQKKKNAIRR